MAEQIKLCPGCGAEAFVWEEKNYPRMHQECSECSFRALKVDWQRRTPGPATQAMIDAACHLRDFQRSRDITTDLSPVLEAFLAEWIERRE